MGTLASYGITSLNLISNNNRQALADGSTIFGQASYTRSNGTTRTFADVALKYGMLGTRQVEGLAGSDTILGRIGHGTLFGVQGDDLLIGEEGNDTLSGGMRPK